MTTIQFRLFQSSTSYNPAFQLAAEWIIKYQLRPNIVSLFKERKICIQSTKGGAAGGREPLFPSTSLFTPFSASSLFSLLNSLSPSHSASCTNPPYGQIRSTMRRPHPDSVEDHETWMPATLHTGGGILPDTVHVYREPRRKHGETRGPVAELHTLPPEEKDREPHPQEDDWMQNTLDQDWSGPDALPQTPLGGERWGLLRPLPRHSFFFFKTSHL